MTTTNRSRSGNPRRSGCLRSRQNPAQVGTAGREEGEQGEPIPAGHGKSQSIPAGVTPAMAGAAVEFRSAGRGGPMVTGSFGFRS